MKLDDIKLGQRVMTPDDERKVISLCLARLDFLERKVQAASRLADAAQWGSRNAILAAAADYDEVTE